MVLLRDIPLHLGVPNSQAPCFSKAQRAVFLIRNRAEKVGINAWLNFGCRTFEFFDRFWFEFFKGALLIKIVPLPDFLDPCLSLLVRRRSLIEKSDRRKFRLPGVALRLNLVEGSSVESNKKTPDVHSTRSYS
jgi:hypothetical protein